MLRLVKDQISNAVLAGEVCELAKSKLMKTDLLANSRAVESTIGTRGLSPPVAQHEVDEPLRMLICCLFGVSLRNVTCFPGP